MLPAYAGMFDRQTVQLTIMPTVMANLLMAGVTLQVAKGLQALVAVVVAILVWRCFRQNPGQLAAAALLVGTFLATPHAFVYDLPMTAAALALFIDSRVETDASSSLTGVLIIVLAFLFPLLMMVNGFHMPIITVLLVLFFSLILWRQRQIDRMCYPVTPAINVPVTF